MEFGIKNAPCRSRKRKRTEGIELSYQDRIRKLEKRKIISTWEY